MINYRGFSTALFITGLILVCGAAGAIDTATLQEICISAIVAILGSALMMRGITGIVDAE